MINNISKDSSSIHVAIAGLGFGQAVHLPAIQANGIFKPVALWHPQSERLERPCNAHNLLGFNDWSSLINNSNIDAIIIATPPEPRFELASKALKAGKHLLLEKPVALNAEEVAELRRLAIQNFLV